MKFDAFISYSHALDGKLAPALQSGLHRFTKPWYKMRAMRVFRDETSLALTPKLWPLISGCLDQAGCLILMASPKAAQSKWVKDEVAHWLQSTPAKNLLVVWTDGELVWDHGLNEFDWERTDALPIELKGYFKEGPPLYLDLRWARKEELSLKHPKFLEAIGQLAAGITGKDLQDMLGDEVKQFRRTRLVVRATITVLCLALVATALGGWFAMRSENRARESLYFASIPAAQESLQRGDKEETLRLLANAPVEHRGWEWDLMRRSTGFAPLRLRHSQIAMLDAGPLKGSGLRELADRMFNGQIDDQLETEDLVVVDVGGGRNGKAIEVQMKESKTPLVSYRALPYSDFEATCLSPDGSCLLILADTMREQMMEGDEMVGSSGSSDHDPANLHILPIPHHFDTAQLAKRLQPYKPSTDDAPAESTDGTPGGEAPTDQPMAEEESPVANDDPDVAEMEEENKVQPISFQTFGKELIDIHANGARSLVVTSHGAKPGEVRVKLATRGKTSATESDLEEQSSTDELLAIAKYLLTAAEAKALKAWRASNPNRIIFAIDWADPSLTAVIVDPEKQKANLISLKRLESGSDFDLLDTHFVWQGIKEWGERAFDIGAAFSPDGRSFLISPFKGEQAAILDRRSLNPIAVMDQRIMNVNDHTGRPDFRAHWGVSPGGHYAYVIGFDAPGNRFYSGICDTNTGNGAEGGGLDEALAMDWDKEDKLFATLDRYTNLISVFDGLGGPVLVTTKYHGDMGADLIQQSATNHDRILIGQMLYRRSDLRPIMALPNNLALASDWSWMVSVAVTQGQSESFWPAIQVAERINDDAADQMRTGADKLQALQLTLLDRQRAPWTRYLRGGGSDAAQLRDELSEAVVGSFEARVIQLTSDFDWPETMSALTVNRMKEMELRSPALLDRAKALLAERPASPDVAFVAAACLALKGGESTTEALKAVEAVLATVTEDRPLADDRWNQLARVLVLNGLNLDEKLGIVKNPEMRLIRRFQEGAMSMPKLEALFEAAEMDQTSDDGGLFELLAAAVEWQQKHPERAAGWLAAIESSESLQSNWIVKAVRKREMPADPPYWFSLIPADVREAMATILVSVLPVEKQGAAILALAKEYQAVNQVALAKRILKLGESMPLPFAEKLEVVLQEAAVDGGKPSVGRLIDLVEEIEEAKIEESLRLSLFGKLAVGEDQEQVKKYADKALSIIPKEASFTFSVDELMGGVCMFKALGEEEGAKKVFDELMQKNPALREEAALRKRAWTEEEWVIMQQNLGQWLGTHPPAGVSAAEVALHKAHTALLLGDDGAAVMAFQKALTEGAQPKADLWAQVLPATFRAEDTIGRMRIIEGAIIAHAGNKTVQASAALALMMAGKKDRALSALKEAERLDEKFVSYGGWETWLRENEITDEAASTAMNAMLDARPIETLNDEFQLVSRGTKLVDQAGADPAMQLRAVSQALPFVRKALDLYPTYEHAKIEFRNALRTRARAFVSLGRDSEAMEAYRVLLQEGGGDVSDYAEPAHLAVKLQQIATARAMLETGRKLHFKSGEWGLAEGWTLLLLGDYAPATKAFQRVHYTLEDDEDLDSVAAGLAISQWLAGDQEGAVEAIMRRELSPAWLSDERQKQMGVGTKEAEAFKAASAAVQ